MSRLPSSMLVGACLALAALTVCAPPARADWQYTLADGKWVQSKAQDVETEVSDNQFAYAVEAQNRGDAQEAERIIEGWLRVYRDKRDCQYALFLLAEARRALGHYDDAYQAYEQLLDNYAGTNLFEHVLGLETEMAEAYLAGKKRKVLKVLWVTAYDEGEEMLERVFQRDPRGARGKKALSRLADYHYKQNRFESAQDEYARLATNFANDADAAEFKRLAGQAALGRFRGVRTDARALDEAELQFRELAAQHPREARRQQVDQILRGIDERRAEKDFEVAEFYRRTKKSHSAIFYYRCISRDYPETVWATQARGRLVEMGAEEKVQPAAPPKVTAVGVGIRGESPEGGGPLAGGPGGEPAEKPGPAVVHWAGPAPAIRSIDESGVIDIGPPIGDNPEPMPIKQMGEVAAPNPTPPTTQPENNHDR